MSALVLDNMVREDILPASALSSQNGPDILRRWSQARNNDRIVIGFFGGKYAEGVIRFKRWNSGRSVVYFYGNTGEKIVLADSQFVGYAVADYDDYGMWKGVSIIMGDM